jgi:hypothetical protein
VVSVVVVARMMMHDDAPIAIIDRHLDNNK